MADPVLTPMLIGGAVGAATNDDPMKGLLMGGALGGIGGHMFGAGGSFGQLGAEPLMAGASNAGLQASGAITSAASPLAPSIMSAASPLEAAAVSPFAGMSEEALYQLSLDPSGLSHAAPISTGGLESIPGVSGPMSIQDRMQGLLGGTMDKISSGDPKTMFQGGMALRSMGGQQQPQQQPMVAAPQIMPRQARSFQQEEQRPYSPFSFNTSQFVRV